MALTVSTEKGVTGVELIGLSKQELRMPAISISGDDPEVGSTKRTDFKGGPQRGMQFSSV